MPNDTGWVAAVAFVGLLLQLLTFLLRYADYRRKAVRGQKERLPEEQPNKDK